ncbi:uncharacterized protein LOC132278428 [Cornus florida]|uniref:uncharacterized protein LOC132278428 n=1 Tax=Cornus florida TaxID=4283 RepID=UPI0028A0408B|nr:uncharacterized protein LOC132278428 [Cornus florida]
MIQNQSITEPATKNTAIPTVDILASEDDTDLGVRIMIRDVISSGFINIGSSHILFLTGDNYSDWKEKILLTLGCMDIDLAVCVDEPPIPTESSTPSEKVSYKRWERSNRLSMCLIKSHVGKNITSSIPECTKVKEYMTAIEQQFISSDKALASTLMTKLSSMKHMGDKEVREHIMEMRDIAAQMNSLEFTFSETNLVQFILNSLLAEFGPFKISYNTHKEKWSVNELFTMCVQEEGRLNQEKLESAYLVTHRNGHIKKGVQFKKKGNASTSKVDDKGIIKCFFCKKKGHMKRNVLSIRLDCLKWGSINLRRPTKSERFIYSGNKMSSHVEVVGTYRLTLPSDFILELERSFYIPTL